MSSLYGFQNDSCYNLLSGLYSFSQTPQVRFTLSSVIPSIGGSCASLVSNIIKDHSDSVRENLLLPHGLLFPSKGSFICIIPQTG